MTTCLTKEELVEITGYKRKKSQLRWLLHNGFCPKPRPDGFPIVSRQHFEAVMSGNDKNPVNGRKGPEPDFGAL